MRAKISDAPSLTMTRPEYLYCVVCHALVNSNLLRWHWTENHPKGWDEPKKVVKETW